MHYTLIRCDVYDPPAPPGPHEGTGFLLEQDTDGSSFALAESGVYLLQE